MRITLLDYGSLLSYVPRGESADPGLYDEGGENPRSGSDPVAVDGGRALRRHQRRGATGGSGRDAIGGLPFASFFRDDPVLVPLPSSSLMQRDSLWVPERISTALVKVGLGKESTPLLVRETPVPKAAWSKSSERPKAKDHIGSMSVQKRIPEPPAQILLVDDIITRGATALGAANKLAEAFPLAQIRAFAAMRTISDPFKFQSLFNPVIGTVQYSPNTEGTVRKP